ncbi:IS6 family transposase [Piscirickettsia litoralis]|nr:IS6 family transposase [Piscirickettsia litoralis]
MMTERGLKVSYESIRRWSKKFFHPITQQLCKKEAQRSDKWCLGEMTTKINGDKYVLLRAVDNESYELNIFIQKCKENNVLVPGSFPSIKFFTMCQTSLGRKC